MLSIFLRNMFQTIPRSAKSRARSRPQSTATFLEDGTSRAGGLGDSDASDADETRTRTAEMLDFGGTDIFGEQGWDTDLEVEGKDDPEALSDRHVMVRLVKRSQNI